MCRILLDKENRGFERSLLEQSWVANKDGSGLYAWNTRTSQYIVKKWDKQTPFNTICRYYEKIKNNKDFVNVCIHFRLATSGETTIKQCHPHAINDNMFIVHNGVFNALSWAKDKSDTQLFAWLMRKINKPFKWWEAHQNALEHTIGKHFNKVVILWRDKSIICNADLGHYKHNKTQWFSWIDTIYDTMYHYSDYGIGNSNVDSENEANEKWYWEQYDKQNNNQ